MKVEVDFKGDNFKSDKTMKLAADELCRYLAKINVSGIVQFSLEVCPNMQKYGIEPVENPALDDRYYVKVSENGGVIVGTNERAVLLCVYAYLRKIGFDFLAPLEKMCYIPNITSSKELVTEFVTVPSFRHRGVCIEGANSLENILDFIKWLPKVGFNSFFLQFQKPFTFMERYYSHMNNYMLKAQEFTLETAEKYSDIIDECMKERSIIHHRCGHGFTCMTAGYSPNDWDKVPLGEPNKSFLALVDGKREILESGPNSTQLCYSNEKVIEALSDNIVNYAKNNQYVDLLHVWLADGFNNICECEECKKSIPTDQYIHILNVVDEKLSALNVGTKIVLLSYMDLLWAPKKEKLHNPNRFILMFAPISRKFMNSYPVDAKLSKEPLYVRNKTVMPTQIAQNLAFLKAWQKSFEEDGQGNIDSFVYDYPLGRAHYGDLSYIKISDTISRDIKSLNQLKLNGYISCQELRASLPNSFPNYVMGISLVDKTISFEHLKERYFKEAYGENYLAVLEYLEKLSTLYDCDYYNGKGERINEPLAQKLEMAMSVISEFKPIIAEAMKNMSDEKSDVKSKINSELNRQFWKNLSYHSEYSGKFTRALIYNCKGEQVKADDCFDDFAEFIRANEEEYQPYLDVYRVVQVSTHFTGFKGKNR